MKRKKIFRPYELFILITIAIVVTALYTWLFITFWDNDIASIASLAVGTALTFMLIGLLFVCKIKGVRKAAKKYQEDFKTFTDIMPTGLMLIYFNDNENLKLNNCYLKYLNAKATRILGLGKSAPSTDINTFLNLIDKNEKDRLVNEIEYQIRQHKEFAIKLPIYTARAQNRRWIRINGYLHTDKDLEMKYLMVNISNLTTEITLQRELSMSNTRLKLLLEESEVHLVEYNYKSKGFYQSPAFQKKFANVFEAIKLNAYTEFIHPDDYQKFQKLKKMIDYGALFCESQMRIKNNEGNYIWCKIITKCILDNHNDIFSIVVKLSDIDSFVAQNMRLEHMATRDGLTSLYNKKATETFIDNYLSGEGFEGTHALILIDIDDFKDINDTYGHKAGDNVITGIAQKLTTHFRGSDIIGRIGGDEFLVFMKDVSDPDFIVNKCKDLNLEFALDDKSRTIVKLSAGIALYPEKGVRFTELYMNADNALYEVKKHGKNNVSVIQ